MLLTTSKTVWCHKLEDRKPRILYSVLLLPKEENRKLLTKKLYVIIRTNLQDPALSCSDVAVTLEVVHSFHILLNY
jgi:hypothetical protein